MTQNTKLDLTLLVNQFTSEKEKIETNIKDLRLSIQNQETNLTDSGDIAQQETEITEINQSIDRKKNRLSKINLAIFKIENNLNYGECDECGYEIPIGRLKAIPEAIHCAECLTVLEHKESQYV